MKKVQYAILIFLLVLPVSCNGNNHTVLPVQRSSSSESDLSSNQPATLEPAKMKITAVDIENPRYLNGNVINTIERAIDEGKDFSYFDRYETGTELNVEDLQNYTYSASGYSYVVFLNDLNKPDNKIHIYMLDLDNDGSDEIIISQWDGGTAGIVGFAVLKKDARGEYSPTINFDYDNGMVFNLNDSLKMVKIGNKNYLMVGNADYSHKTFSGITLYSFLNGQFSESAYFDIYSQQKYKKKRSFFYSRYIEYVNSVDMDNLIRMTKSGGTKIGTAEKPLNSNSTEFQADINNDGKTEIINKHYSFTSIYYFPSYLRLGIESSSPNSYNPLTMLEGTSLDKNNDTKILQQFWCDHIDRQNVINILYRYQNDPVFYLDIFLLNESELLKVAWIKASPEKNLEIKYYQYSVVPVKDRDI